LDQRRAKPHRRRRGAAARLDARIRAGGVERAVAFAEATADAHTAIDTAYHSKYDRYGPDIVGSVVGPAATDVTIRLVPHPGQH
jgi:hypothetical protein